MGEDLKACIICRKQSGDFPAPGGAICQNNLIYASHAHYAEGQSDQYLGWLVIEPRRHILGLADLTDAEAQAIGLLAARLSRLLKTLLGAEHIYAFVLGHGAPHLHLHLLPRYPGTPREYWGTRIDEWSGAPRGDEKVLTELCAKLRASLARKELNGN